MTKEQLKATKRGTEKWEDVQSKSVKHFLPNNIIVSVIQPMQGVDWKDTKKKLYKIEVDIINKKTSRKRKVEIHVEKILKGNHLFYYWIVLKHIFYK